MRTLGLIMLLLALGGSARAWESRPQSVTYLATKNLFDDFAYDTGWRPAGSSIQVRFALIGGTGWSASVKGRGDLRWPEAVTLRMLGDPQGGVLFQNVGVQLIGKLRFHLDTDLGTIDWEGDVPFMSAFDFRFGGEVQFDPFLLPGASPATVVVSDTIPQRSLFKVDLTEALIPIPGIGGGFELLVSGTLVSTLRGDHFDIDDGATFLGRLGHADGALAVPPALGGRQELGARYLASLNANGQVELTPAVFIQFGKTWDMPLFTVPITLVDKDLEWDFGRQPLAFPLPDIAVSVASMDFGQVPAGATRSQQFDVANYGELDLELTAAIVGDDFSVSPTAVTIAPGLTTTLTVSAAPPARSAAAQLQLASNDPDEPLVTVPLTANGAWGGIEQIPGDGGVPVNPAGPDPGVPTGCGCRAGAAPGATLFALLPTVLLLRRRRAARPRPPR